MNFNYQHGSRKSPLKITQERRREFGFNSGFSSSTSRFQLDEITSNPGVGTYETNKSSFLQKSPSFSSKGFGNSFLSKTPQITPFQDLGNPGPSQYNIRSFSDSPPKSKRRPTTSFIASGNGRIPFPPPNSNPGPSDYYINFDPGRSQILLKKESATFSSVTDRNSVFDQVTVAPPPGKYRVEKADKFFKKAEGDIDWSRGGAREERFNHIGKDNHVPPPNTYFPTPYFNPATTSSSGQTLTSDGMHMSPKRHNSGLASLDVGGNNLAEDSVRSLRSVGNYRGKLKGKLNERPATTHTFGADKDRFKNSAFGRLDLIAEIPGPGTYNLQGDSISDNLHRKLERAATASSLQSPLK
jgi:hypothetical protein